MNRLAHAAIALAAASLGCSQAAAIEGSGSAESGSTTSAGTSAAEVAGTSSTVTEAPQPSATGTASHDAPHAAPWASRLAPVLFRDVNTLAEVMLRLYKDDGSLDEEAATEVERVLWAAKDDVAPHMSRRLLQLVVKAAALFDAHEVQVISSHRGRARKGSRHRSGEAIDFVFPGIPPKKLAEALRKLPRVGVGIYVHPRSQFVHLDVREQSYHWIDGSPPGRTWREQPLADPTAPARDAAYTPAQDLPGDAG